MRVGKQRRHRKAVRFYTACCGFRQPFKVLLDGTFVHHLIVNHIIPADKAVSNILGSPVKLFTTKCVLEELKRLGSAYSETVLAAQKLLTARCDHDMKGADACIREIIGENNLEHFFVATQDSDLRKKFREIPSVPIIFALRNALFLEAPSAFQRQFIKTSEEERLHMTDVEKKILKMRTKDIVATEEDEPALDNEELLENENSDKPAVNKPAVKKHPARMGMEVKDKVQFKRKRAKGPNPLSCKKKKTQKSNPVPEKAKDGDSTVRSRNRKRKRTRKSKKLLETENQ